MNKIRDKISNIIFSIKQWRLSEWIACGICVFSIAGVVICVNGFLAAKADYEQLYPDNQAKIKALETELAAFDNITPPTVEEIEAITVSAYEKGLSVAQLQNEYQSMIRMDTTLTASAKADMKVQLKQELMEYFDPDSAAGYDEWFILPDNLTSGSTPQWTFVTDIESTSNEFQVIWLMTEKADDDLTLGKIVAYTTADFIVEDKTKPETGRFYNVKTVATDYGISKYTSEPSEGADAPDDTYIKAENPELSSDATVEDIITEDSLASGFSESVANRGANFANGSTPETSTTVN